MHDASRILDVSFLVILALLVVATARVGFSGYASTLGGSQFGYKFDKTRLPHWGLAVLVVMSVCLIYATAVMKLTEHDISYSIGTAIAFCVLLLPFVALGCLLRVCYVPRDSIPTDVRKHATKTAKSDNNWKLP